MSSWELIGLDIDGEASGDWSGNSVSLSSDGTVVAIGAPYNDGNGNRSGHVRIYQWDGTKWEQKGLDIDGISISSDSGFSVSLSSDGNIVAIGAINNNVSKGYVRIYEWDVDSWELKGSDIVGEASGDYSGFSVSLSSEGNIVAIGAPYNDSTSGTDSGHVRIYEWDGTKWEKKGLDIDGEASDDNSGYSVSLSSNGNIVAIGAYLNDGTSGTDSGHVRIYEWNGTKWEQKGTDIDGEAGGDQSGCSVSLSSDGNIVAIGARNNDASNIDSGHVRIYEWDGSRWEQKGLDIDGTGLYARYGDSVSLSSDGNIVAMGSISGAGRVRIYEWDGDSWELKGSDIVGEASGDQSGWSVSLSSNGHIVAIGSPFNSGKGHVRIYGFNGILPGEILPSEVTLTSDLLFSDSSIFVASGTKLFTRPELASESALAFRVLESEKVVGTVYNPDVVGGIFYWATTEDEITIFGETITLDGLNEYIVDYNFRRYTITVDYYGGSGGGTGIESSIPCFTETCNILTPCGYKNVSGLLEGDVVITSDGRESEIKHILKRESNSLPYVIPSSKYGDSVPLVDTYISGNHMYNVKGKWLKPCEELEMKWNSKMVTYYNILLDNYKIDNVIVNGIEMESWDGLMPNETRDYKWSKKGRLFK